MNYFMYTSHQTQLRDRIYLSLKSVAYVAGPEKWRTLPGFIFFRSEKYNFSTEQ